MVVPRRSILLTALLMVLLAFGAAPGFPANASPAHAAGSLALSRAQAGPGDSVVIRGYGFTPQDSVVVSAAFNGGGTSRPVQVAAHANSGGQFVATLTVPGNSDPGPYRVQARDFHGVTASATLSVLRLITLQVNGVVTTTYIVAGHQFYVRGAGFAAGETVQISAAFPLFNGNTVTVNKTVTADSSGSFGEVLLQVPGGARQAAVTLSATGKSSKKKAAASIHPIYHPSVTLSQATIRPGGSTTISGTGFVPGSRVSLSATIARGATTQSLTQVVTADAYGNFSTAFAVPADAHPGSYVLSATDYTGGLSARQNLIVAVQAGITVRPGTASPGQTVTVNGAGFSANVTVTVSAAFPLYGGGSRSVRASAHTNGNGQFSIGLTVPGHAAAGGVSITARGPHAQTSARVLVNRVLAGITVSPSSVIPGGSVTVTGAGYLPHDRVDVSMTVSLTNGGKQTVTVTANTDGQGRFTAALRVPGNALGGTFNVVARSEGTGRAPLAHVTVAALAPSVVVVPTTATPGAPAKVNGFGFAAGSMVTVSLGGQKVGTATTNGNGQFSLTVTIPGSTASGTYPVTAVSSAGRRATISLTVNRSISTHFYFAAFYTGSGYHEYLAFLNPSATRARVTITYGLIGGRTETKTLTVNAHSRATEDVNADLGVHVSAGATVAADVPIAASRVVYHGTDGAISPGAQNPSTVWYFANGNTSRRYREYLAIENPNNGGVQVAVHFLPTHHAAFTIYRNMPANSRTTVKVNSFVKKDAVGVTVTSNGPVVVNRSIFIRHGMTSKIGVTSPQRTWYFAGGPANGNAHNWIGVTNPFNRWSYVTVHAYGPAGSEAGTAKGWLKPYARAGYLINRIAGGPNAAIALTASAPVVAEQTTYVGSMHDASTDTFGIPAPGKAWNFPVVDTGNGQSDVLTLFNPNLVPVPVVVQFMTSSGTVMERTYVVGPLNHQRIDVATVAPNAQLGIVAASNYPFVALNRASFDNGSGSMTSPGLPG